MKYIMILIMFGKSTVETSAIEFDSQLTCENTKTSIIQQYDDRRIGNVPVILCVKK